MNFRAQIFASAIFLTTAATSMAGLIGSPVTLTTSQTGGTTITAGSSSTVGSGSEFSYCLGPNSNNCVSSGVTSGIDISDNVIDFFFTGGTFETDGSFTLVLSGFNVPITGVTASSTTVGFPFSLISFDSSSITFTGTPSAVAPTTPFNSSSVTLPNRPSGGSSYDAVGGSSASFAVTTDTAEAPEPASIALVGLGATLIGLVQYRRRARQ
ncbi:MAG: hypothetical protein JWN34_5570 [Bryobacterales bacterium]|jgi:hypothetical protein|nr:hypothetical protein [Bryobacterales bacterium]